VRSGRYGPYLVHGEDRVSIPEATEPDSLSVTRALELLAAPSNDRSLGDDPSTGLPVLLKAGRFGPYVQLGEMVEGEKPKTASLFSSMTPETMTLEDALKLLSLPRAVGVHPSDGAAIEAMNGRYGPYITWGKETRSLDSEDAIFTIDTDAAVALLAQPKQRGRRAAAGPLRELGADPSTGKHIVVRTGRFGPYVTDGDHNATLRVGDTPETVSLDRACELLAERRNADPRPARAAKKTTAKKTTATKSVAKKSTAKKAGKKAAATKVTKGAAKKAATKATAARNAALVEDLGD